MSEPQAEAAVEVVHGNIKAAFAHLATKSDVTALWSEILTMKSGLEARMSAMESRLTWRLSGMILGVGGGSSSPPSA